jgi:hypothetical protein
MQLSDMPREKDILQILPKYVYIYIYFKKKHKNQNMKYGNDIICKAKSNVMMPLQKTVARPAFSVFLKKYLQNSLKKNRGQNKIQLVSRLHKKYNSKISNQT